MPVNPKIASPTFILVIDTEEYSGNFEREMCAWMTAQVGECTVGRDLAEQAKLTMSFALQSFCASHIVRLPDDRPSPCLRPASIWPTPGWFNDGSGNHHREGTPGEVVQSLWMETIEAQQKEMLNIWETDPEYAKQISEEYAAKKTGPERAPAYQSVAIFFDAHPCDILMEELVQRAQVFCDEYHKRGRLQQFRLGKFREDPIAFTGFWVISQEEEGASMGDVSQVWN